MLLKHGFLSVLPRAPLAPYCKCKNAWSFWQKRCTEQILIIQGFFFFTYIPHFQPHKYLTWPKTFSVKQILWGSNIIYSEFIQCVSESRQCLLVCSDWNEDQMNTYSHYIWTDCVTEVVTHDDVSKVTFNLKRARYADQCACPFMKKSGFCHSNEILTCTMLQYDNI